MTLLVKLLLQDTTFVTRVHDFTGKVKEMRAWLEQCEAQGGGDTPEAVADALHDVLKLSWRPEATKICILISDAPPHGLDPTNGDGFPEGDPTGVDPIKTVREMAEKQITLYVVGVEPPIGEFISFLHRSVVCDLKNRTMNACERKDIFWFLILVPYRDFFMSLAYITGGQYVPMINAKLLAQVIIGGVREEISLERLMQDAQEDINREMQAAEAESVDEQEMITRVNRVLLTKNMRVKQMDNLSGQTSEIARTTYAKCADMSELRSRYVVQAPTHADYGPIMPPGLRTRAGVRASRLAMATKTEEEALEGASAGAPPPPAPTADMSYGLKEDESVSMAQTERIVQRMRSKR